MARGMADAGARAGAIVNDLAKALDADPNLRAFRIANGACKDCTHFSHADVARGCTCECRLHENLNAFAETIQETP